MQIHSSARRFVCLRMFNVTNYKACIIVRFYLGMMLDRHEEQDEPVEELNPAHPRHPHVEEDAEQDGKGDELQH